MIFLYLLFGLSFSFLFLFWITPSNRAGTFDNWKKYIASMTLLGRITYFILGGPAMIFIMIFGFIGYGITFFWNNFLKQLFIKNQSK